MLKSLAKFSKTAAVGAIAMGLTLVAGAASAAPGSFSFRSVEYLPQDEREAAAQAFIGAQVTSGMPVATAVDILRKAGTDCSAVQSGQVRCSFTSAEQRPDEDLGDVSWIVLITPTADKTVSSASLQRIRTGL